MILPKNIEIIECAWCKRIFAAQKNLHKKYCQKICKSRANNKVETIRKMNKSGVRINAGPNEKIQMFIHPVLDKVIYGR